MNKTARLVTCIGLTSAILVSFCQPPRIAWSRWIEDGFGSDIVVDWDRSAYVTGHYLPRGYLTIRYAADSTIMWQQTEPSGAYANALCLLPGFETRVFNTGRSQSVDPTIENILTFAYTSAGSRQCELVYSTPCSTASTKDEEGHDIAFTTLGAVCVVGRGYCPRDSGGYGYEIVTLWYSSVCELLAVDRFNVFPEADFESGYAVDAGVYAEHVTGVSSAMETSYIVTIKYGHPGEPSWYNLYPGNSQSGPTAGYDIRSDFAGNVYVTGTYEGNFIVLKYSRYGAILWAYVYDSGGLDVGRAIDIDSSGNVIAVGNSAADFFVVKLDPQGRVLWTFSDANSEGAEDVAVDLADNIYATGPRLTVKLYPNGTVSWTTRPCLGDYAGGYALALDPNATAYPAVYITSSFTAKILQSPADVNGDNCVDDADLLEILLQFGRFLPCSAYDLNGDGVVDDADLLIVLLNFGECW